MYQVLTPAEAAKVLGVTPRTLANLHTRPPAYGAPPIYLRTSGGHRRYRRADLIAWRDSRPRGTQLQARVPRSWAVKGQDFLTTDNPYAGLQSQAILELLTIRTALEHQAAAQAISTTVNPPGPTPASLRDRDASDLDPDENLVLVTPSPDCDPAC